MEKMEFHENLCKWILECLRSALVSILVNDSHTKEFHTGWSLRQGYPFISFLILNSSGRVYGSNEESFDMGKLVGYKFKGGEQHFSISSIQMTQ